MAWYFVQFDPNWVRCRNSACLAEFTLRSVVARRKCPVCKVDSKGYIKPKKETKP